MGKQRWLVWLLIGLLAGLAGCGLIGGEEPAPAPTADPDAAATEAASPREAPTPTPTLPPTFTPPPANTESGFTGNVDAESAGEGTTTGGSSDTGSAGGTAVDVMDTYVVQRGDTLGLIAQRYGVTISAIAEANNIQNIDRIEVGTSLIIPQP